MEPNKKAKKGDRIFQRFVKDIGFVSPSLNAGAHEAPSGDVAESREFETEFEKAHQTIAEKARQARLARNEGRTRAFPG